MPSNTQNIFQKLKQKEIKHIVFDLGGVIVTLDPQLTSTQFSILSGKSIREINHFPVVYPVFNQYEKGEIDNGEFRDGVRRLLEVDASDATIDSCWNAMIVDILKERLDWLSTLKEKYHVSILSNTNDIHISYVHQLLEKHHNLDDFSSLVHDVYYSHEIKMRKPDHEIYQHVLDNAPYLPEETLFLDDNFENIEGATTLGIRTIHVTDPKDIPTLLANEGVQL